MKSKKELVRFVFNAVFAGVAIAVGGTASLLACSLLEGLWGKFVGALLFSLGMFLVITYGFKLFTGMVAGIPTMGYKNYWQLPLCFVANGLGVALVAVIVRYSFIGDTIAMQAQTLMSGKLGSDLWAVKTLCSAIACGMLITFSAWAPQYAPIKKLSATLGVLLPIIVFVFCGFDHSVANMYYLILNGQCTWQIVGYLALSIVGNILGGVLLPLVVRFTKDKE
jgi:formate/nitrite transporter FocA (FNT family)